MTRIELTADPAGTGGTPLRTLLRTDSRVTPASSIATSATPVRGRPTTRMTGSVAWSLRRYRHRAAAYRKEVQGAVHEPARTLFPSEWPTLRTSLNCAALICPRSSNRGSGPVDVAAAAVAAGVVGGAGAAGPRGGPLSRGRGPGPAPRRPPLPSRGAVLVPSRRPRPAPPGRPAGARGAVSPPAEKPSLAGELLVAVALLSTDVVAGAGAAAAVSRRATCGGVGVGAMAS